MASNWKNKRLKSLEKKYQKVQKLSFTVALLIICSGNSRKFSKKTDSAPETPLRSFFIVIFQKFEKGYSSNPLKNLDGNGKYGRKVIMGLMILTSLKRFWKFRVRKNPCP